MANEMEWKNLPLLDICVCVQEVYKEGYIAFVKSKDGFFFVAFLLTLFS